MRIAHFSDLHYAASTLDEADRCFGAAIDRAINEDVEVAIVSGDATDHALDLHEPATLRLLAQVKRLADHCPVLMLQGTFSHEPPGTLSVFRMLGAQHAVHVADQIRQVALTTGRRWCESSSWCFDTLPPGAALLVSCIPTVNKAAVAATFGASCASQTVGEHLVQLMGGLAPSNRAARQQGLPTVLVSHGTVFGSLSEHGVPMAGMDHEFTTGALFNAASQAVMLGHIHRHQSWLNYGAAGQQCVAYAGSIGRFHFGEEGEKGFLLWNVDAAAAECTLVPTPARRTIDVFFEGQPDLEELRRVVADQKIDGAHVRVRWSVADEDRHAIDRAAISEILRDATKTKLEGRIVPIVRSRAPGIATLGTLALQVRRWAEVTGIEAADILECLDSLNESPPDEIAARLLEFEPDSAPEARAQRLGQADAGPPAGNSCALSLEGLRPASSQTASGQSVDLPQDRENLFAFTEGD